ncbi:hypothetical protein H9Y04_28775 [Streptomyces sp. TRM66268-LWL]|uniref:SecDF P1 head subdomain domain-containing protein n=1 Tax=Streptomyces polyasparticus TaxID=2767826 RepID=A0ABR7SQC9_9ACTN|nr:hypothetical protein [Streptomyces polyasparticus]
MKWGLVPAGVVLALAACGGASSGDGDWLGRATGAGSSAPADGSSSASAPPASGGSISVTFTPRGSAGPPPAEALEQTAALMRKRAESAGLRGVEVAVKDGGIVVSGGGGDEEALKSLGRTAELGFRPVRNAQMVAKDACQVREAAAAEPLTTCGTDASGATTQYVLERVALPGTEIARAQAAHDKAMGTWTVNLEFTAQGTAHFADVTAELAQQQPPANQFAIVLDGEVVSAPSVQQALTGGRAQISGSFTERSARELAAQLSSGALPVDLEASSVTRVPGS